MKILVADDDPMNRHLLESFLLKWKYEVVLARDGKEAWNILRQKDAPRLAILDWMMPEMDGTEVCHEARKHNNTSYIYILLLTAKFQKQDIIAGLEAGADDHLTKPFDAGELQARLRTGIRILELQEKVFSANENLKFQVAHDALTDLLSRPAILETVRTELARAKRERSTVGILLADLDHFKQVNDSFGHLAGDEVLRETAKRMRSSVRPYDAIGRYGGEEFLIVLPGCDISSAINRAEGLRVAVGKEPIETPEGMIPVTLSLGVTMGGGVNSPDGESLLRDADIALYQAKSAGRNQLAVFGESPEQWAVSFQKSGAEMTLVEGYQ